MPRLSTFDVGWVTHSVSSPATRPVAQFVVGIRHRLQAGKPSRRKKPGRWRVKWCFGTMCSWPKLTLKDLTWVWMCDSSASGSASERMCFLSSSKHAATAPVHVPGDSLASGSHAPTDEVDVDVEDKKTARATYMRYYRSVRSPKVPSAVAIKLREPRLPFVGLQLIVKRDLGVPVQEARAQSSWMVVEGAVFLVHFFVDGTFVEALSLHRMFNHISQWP